MEEKVTMNKMGTEPVNRLMVKMGVPMIISMVLQALYNVVDSYFVSNMKDTAEISGMGEYAVNALTLAFPVQMLMVSFHLDAIFHYGFNKDIDPSPRYIKPKRAIINEIYKVGLPAIIMQALMSFMTYGVNIIFGAVSSAAVTAYGVYYKIQQFVFFAAFGMNNALIPIESYNYGKRDRKRVDEGIKYGMIYTLLIMAVGLLGLQIFADQLAGIFSVAPETQKLCVLAIRIVTIGYLFAGANIAYQGIFQALGCGIRSLILSLLRLIVVALPLAWLFTKFQNASVLIWVSFPIAEGVALAVGILFMKQIADKQLKGLK